MERNELTYPSVKRIFQMLPKDLSIPVTSDLGLNGPLEGLKKGAKIHYQHSHADVGPIVGTCITSPSYECRTP